MRVINRTAVTIVGGGPYVEWTRSCDADLNKGSLTVARSTLFGTAYLLPELDYEEDLLEWVEDNYVSLFEWQLSTWTEDESVWPQVRDLKTFKEWFRVDIHNTVVDVGDDEIDGEEL
jgi:hypothetical protein